MTDLSRTVEPKSDQINADDLIAGPRTITVTRVSACPDSMEQPIAIYFDGDNGKPFKPCKSMRRVLIAVWGADGTAYPGKSMTLYRDPKVKFGGLEVGGIRISHMSGIDRPMTMALTATRAKRAPYTVQPLVIEDTPNPDETLAAAKVEARKGTDAFRSYWRDGLTAAQRDMLRPHIQDLQKIATDADAPAADDEDPFGLPPIKATPSTSTAAVLAEIRTHLESGADAESCRAFLADKIDAAIAADANAKEAIEAAFAEA